MTSEVLRSILNMNKKLTKLRWLLLLILQFTLRGNLGKKNNELPLIIRLRVAIVKVWHKTTAI